MNEFFSWAFLVASTATVTALTIVASIRVAAASDQARVVG